MSIASRAYPVFTGQVVTCQQGSKIVATFTPDDSDRRVTCQGRSEADALEGLAQYLELVARQIRKVYR